MSITILFKSNQPVISRALWSLKFNCIKNVITKMMIKLHLCDIKTIRFIQECEMTYAMLREKCLEVVEIV